MSVKLVIFVIDCTSYYEHYPSVPIFTVSDCLIIIICIFKLYHDKTGKIKKPGKSRLLTTHLRFKRELHFLFKLLDSKLGSFKLALIAGKFFFFAVYDFCWSVCNETFV